MIKEIIIHYRTLPWFDSNRLKSILSNLANINNKIHFTGWRIISVNVDTHNNRIIIKAIPPKYVELGMSDWLIPVIVIGGLIIAAGVVITGWEAENIKQNELQFKKSIIKAVEEHKIPQQIAEKVLSENIETPKSKTQSPVSSIVSSINTIVISISVLMLLYLIIKLLGGVKLGL